MLFEFGITPSVRHVGIWLLINIKVGTERTLYLSHMCLPTSELTSIRKTLHTLDKLVSSLLTAGFAAVHASHQSE